MEAGYDVAELDALAKSLLHLANDVYPKETKAFMRQEGAKNRKKMRQETMARTKKRTGNLLKGIGSPKVSKYEGDFQVRVSSRARHAHLIEKGHVTWRNGREAWVPGKEPVEAARQAMAPELLRDAEKFMDEMLDGVFDK